MKKEQSKELTKKLKLSLPNIKGFLQGNYRKFKWEVLKLPIEIDKKEQINRRFHLVSENSPECLQKGECYCGCGMPEKLYEDRGCEGWEEGKKTKPCYPDMMNKEDWEKYKTENFDDNI